MRTPKALLTLAFLISTLPMFGAIYIKFDGVDGESKAAGHDKWIELSSVQFEGDSCAVGARLTGLRRATISTSAIPQQLDRACQSQTRFRSVIVDVDGKRHVLQNAKLVDCPTNAGAPVVLRVEFGSCATHDAWPQKVEIGALKAGASEATMQRSNATMVGLTREPLEMDILRASLAGNTATVSLRKNSSAVVSLGKLIVQATANGTTIPVLTIKSAGQQWTFSKVMFTSASFPAGQDALFTFQFEAMNGNAAAFQALGGN